MKSHHKRFELLRLGLPPYVEPLFGINDEGKHRGVEVGGPLDFSSDSAGPTPAE